MNKRKATNTKNQPKIKTPEIRQSSDTKLYPQGASVPAMPNQPTARMKIIRGRPYYYEVWSEWDPITKTCKQHSKYLGKELPKGYRLVK